MPHDAPARGSGQPHLVHFPQFGVDELRRCAVRGERGRELKAEPLQEGGCWCQRHQHRQQGRFADQQGDPWAPEPGGGIPVAQQRGGPLPRVSGDRAEPAEQLPGRPHDQHRPILPGCTGASRQIRRTAAAPGRVADARLLLWPPPAASARKRAGHGQRDRGPRARRHRPDRCQ